MYQVKNGVITSRSLPKVGTLSTGQTVSGYNLLDLPVLLAEGWLPVEEALINPPEGQQFSGWDEQILADKVLRTPTYTVISETPSYAFNTADMTLAVLEADTSMTVQERVYFQKRFEDLIEEMKVTDPIRAQALWDQYTGVTP